MSLLVPKEIPPRPPSAYLRDSEEIQVVEPVFLLDPAFPDDDPCAALLDAASLAPEGHGEAPARELAHGDDDGLRPEVRDEEHALEREPRRGDDPHGGAREGLSVAPVEVGAGWIRRRVGGEEVRAARGVGGGDGVEDVPAAAGLVEVLLEHRCRDRCRIWSNLRLGERNRWGRKEDGFQGEEP